MWTEIKQFLLELLSKHVPSKLTSSRFNQPWITTSVKRLTRRKKRSFVRARRSQKQRDFEKYLTLKKQSRTACKKAYNTYLTDIVSPDSKCNPKRFWGFINSKRCEHTGVAPLKSGDGITFSDGQNKAEILNTQFTSVFNKNENQSNIKDKGISPHAIMDNITVSPAGVFKLLSSLKVHKATGPDDLPARLLKELALELTPIFTIFYQASLDQGEIPDDWRKANVAPVFKKGERNKAENYRPISLTCISCKVLEHIVSSSIMNHLEDRNILSDAQHGFRKRRSCESQLILAIQDLAKGIDDKQQHDVLLLDFSKAFDVVPHSRLLYKLHFYGIQDNTHKWISAFLRDRTQQVTLEGTSSSIGKVTSGVPQGSVVGPMLFLLYINDLPECISPGTTVRLFADDCMLYRNIRSEADTIQLQEDLDALQQWEDDWLMKFNPKKCQTLHVTNKRRPIIKSYNIHGEFLEKTNTAKYLGVHLTPNLNWNHHINVVSKKANSTSAFLQRNIRSCPRNTKELCYKTLVRPNMEYACTIWDPFTQANKHKLEMVQRRYARFIYSDFRRTSSVTDMLHQLHWPTLEERRAQFKVVMMYRIVFSLIDIPPDIVHPSATTTTRGHSHKLLVPHTRLVGFQGSFFPDTIRLWNALPQDAFSCTTLAQFKQVVQDARLR